MYNYLFSWVCFLHKEMEQISALPSKYVLKSCDQDYYRVQCETLAKNTYSSLGTAKQYTSVFQFIQ